LGDAKGKIVIDKGTARIESLGGKSADLEVRVEGDISLRDPVAFSSVNICLLVKPSEAAAARENSLMAMTTALGSAKRPDGFYGFRVTGRIDSARAAPAKCGGTGAPASIAGGKPLGTPPPPPAFPPPSGTGSVGVPPPAPVFNPPPAAEPPPPPPLPPPPPVDDDSPVRVAPPVQPATPPAAPPPVPIPAPQPPVNIELPDKDESVREERDRETQQEREGGE
jgi:hypothetical protein